MSLKIYQISLKEANAFVFDLHRHHGPVVGHKFSIGAFIENKLVGVAIVDRPVARNYDKLTLEVNRLCTDGTPHACSFLYAACWRISRELGYARLITYTLETEAGISLKAAGWTHTHTTAGGSWSCPTRPRTNKAPTCPKLCWVVGDVDLKNKHDRPPVYKQQKKKPISKQTLWRCLK